jgi:hypothetical protein
MAVHWETYDRLRGARDIAEARSMVGLTQFVDRLQRRARAPRLEIAGPGLGFPDSGRFAVPVISLCALPQIGARSKKPHSARRQLTVRRKPRNRLFVPQQASGTRIHAGELF